MKRADAISLNAALSTEGLKVKYLDTGNYVKLLALKRPLTKYINEMAEEERDLCKGFEIATEDFVKKYKSDKSFREKADMIQGKEFQPKELNFLNLEEFEKFTKEVDFGVGSILAEYLLKE